MPHDSDGAYAPISGKPNPVSQKIREEWEAILPVPQGSPQPPQKLYTGETPTTRWIYRDANGGVLGVIYRFDKENGKEFRPAIFCRNIKTRKQEWRWKSWPAPRPLFGLDLLANKPDAPVLVCEGEKCATAAQTVLPGWVVITSPGGSKAVSKADWSPLKGRYIVVWPDNDSPGSAYAKEVSKQLLSVGAASISIVVPPTDKPEGWDIFDGIQEGWSGEEIEQFISSAKPVSSNCTENPLFNGDADGCDAGGEKSDCKKRISKCDQALALLDDVELWRDERDTAYATFVFRSRTVHSKIRDRVFLNFVRVRYLEGAGGVMPQQAEQEVLNTLTAQALASGPCYKAWKRVAFHGEAIAVDLANSKGELVMIDRVGWRVTTNSEIKFLRNESTRPLPAPIASEEDQSAIHLLREFLNVESDEDFLLAIAWLIGAFRPVGPYPILTVSGEMGSGKSFFSELMTSIVDPADGKRVSAPKDERDLFIVATHQHTLLFDNVSGVSRSMSDSFCRLATGGAIVTRKLHSDDELTSIKAQSPICLNGIPDLAKQSDLADRAIPLQLKTLEGNGRVTEEELNARLEKHLPVILGALFDGLAAGIRNWEDTKIENPPRMADFARWVEACASGLGWEPGEFLQAYQANRQNAYQISFESDPVAQTLKDMLDEDYPRGWEGTATRLLVLLNERATEIKKKEPGWPRSPSAMGTAAVRIAPLLRKNGWDIQKKHSGNRSIQIRPKV